MNLNKSNVAIVYATYDGAINSTCGVGVLSRFFINAVPKVIKEKLDDQRELSFHVIAIDLTKSAHGYSDSILAETEASVQQSNGHLWLISNGTDGNENYGHRHNWERASKNAADRIEELSKEYDHVIAFLVDTPFLQVPLLARERGVDSDSITYVLVPHSDVYSHFPDNIPQDRLEWEAEAFHAASVLGNVYLASTSRFLTGLLARTYDIEDSKIINLQTGLNLSDPKFDELDDQDIAEKLNEYKIPTDKRIVFSVARAVPYKGFEALIEAFKLLHDSYADTHLVFIASPFRNSPSNVNTLQKMIDELGLNESCTAIYNLDMELPRYICQWANTKIVAQLSYREPFGMVPEEVRVWAKNKGPIVLASNVDGFVEQVTDGVDGYLTNPHSINEIVDKMRRIMQLTYKQTMSIRGAGYHRCIRDYDYARTVSVAVDKIVSAP